VKLAAKPAAKPALKPAMKVLPKVEKTAASKQKTLFHKSSDEFSNDDEEEPSPAPAKRLRSAGPPWPVPVMTKIRKASAQKRKARSAEDFSKDSSEYFNFDDHDDNTEEEEETMLPPAKKTRSAGPSDTSWHSLAMQEGGGRSSKASKHITFASSNGNNPAVLAERCQRMNTTPPPESQVGPSGHTPGGHSGRNDVPAGHNPHVAGPFADPMPATPAELAVFLGKLTNASSSQLSVLMSSIKFNTPLPS
jgi:hypothetical protein